MRKVLLISTIIALVALVAFLGWYFFSKNSDTSTGDAIRNTLPFGPAANTPQSTNNTQNEEVGNNTNQQQVAESGVNVVTANLFPISREPVAGEVILNKGTSTAIVRYVDRATGHIYDFNLNTGMKTTVTNQTLPKIYQAYFRSDGSMVIFRSLKGDTDAIDNLSLTLTAPKGTSTDNLYTISSTALRGDIDSVAVGSGNILFYNLKDTSSIVSSTFNGTGLKTLYKSAFTDWHLSSGGNSLIAYPKASADAAGYAYMVNISNGGLTKVLGPFNGLTAIPNNSGDKVLYSYVEDARTRLFVKNLKNKALSEMFPTTLAEKCIWSIKKTGVVFCAVPTDDLKVGEPDNWYKGVTHFSDRIWKFDTNTDIAQVLVEPKTSLNIDIDLVDPKLSPKEDYLIFTNKTDLSLWALKLQ